VHIALVYLVLISFVLEFGVRRGGCEVAMRGDERATPACWRVFNGGEMRLAIA
jgi:hypothetical protein